MLDELKFILFAVFFVIGTAIGAYIMNRSWEKDAMIRGFGYYSEVGPNFSASFEWVNIVNDTEMKRDQRNLWYKKDE